MIDLSPESMEAQADAIRGVLAIDGRECAVCPTGETEPGEELCPACEVQFGNVTQQELEELLHAA